jgi:hypothetical protein
MPRLPSTLFADQLRELQHAITALAHGAASATWLGTAYTSADLPTLATQHERLSAKAAIQAIEEGGQAYQHGDTTYTRADLKTLYARRDTLERRAATTTRGGGRVRLAVPLG